MLRRARAFAILAGTALAPSAWAQPLPVGSEFRSNTYTLNSQNQESVAMNATGSFVVVWQSSTQDGSGSGIFSQRFSDAGAPQGAEFRANVYTTSNQLQPAVGISSTGSFVVVWESFGQDGSGYGIFGRRYDSAGSPIGGDFQINTYTTSNQYIPSVAMSGSGSFVVAWQSPQDGSSTAILGRRYDSAGSPIGGEFQINTYTTGYQGAPEVAMDGAGNFLVVWSSSRDGSGEAVSARRYNSAGVAQGSEFQVNVYTTGYQVFPRAAHDGSGNFVVVWFSPQDGAGYGVFGRRYNSSGVAQGGEFQVNTFTASDQSYPAVARESTGSFVVSWSSFTQDGSVGSIYAQRFDGAGVRLGSEFRVNTYTTDRQAGSVLAGNMGRRLVAIWRSNLQDGSGDGVYGQLYCIPDGASCDDGNPCTTDSCNPSSGCVHLNNTTACSDGNACTTNDLCAGGVCVGGPAPNCDDANVCTDDSCSPALGCVNDANSAVCDDGSTCTIDDVCKGGLCVGNAAPALGPENDSVVLSVDKGPGPHDVRLSWTGGQPLYRVSRSALPNDVLDAGHDLAMTSSLTMTDPTSPGDNLFFYLVQAQSPYEPPSRAPADPSVARIGYPPESTPARGLHLFSGELHLEAEDMRIEGRGLDFVWARKYRSRIGPFTAMGNGWDFSYNIRVLPSGPDLYVLDGNTRADLYRLQADGTWSRPEFFRVLRQQPDQSFTLTFSDTSRWNFRPFDGSVSAGRISSIVDRNGNTIAFAYDGAGRLTAVTDTLGRNFTIGYNTDGYVETVTDFTGRQVRYTYYQPFDAGGSAGDLRSARTPIVTGTPNGNNFPAGKTVFYTYSTGLADNRLNHNLLTATDPKGQIWLRNTYAPATDPLDPSFDRVTRQVWGDIGDNIDVVYVTQTPSTANNQAAQKAIVNDRVGNVREFSYDFRNRLVMVREYTGRANPDQPTSESSNRPTGKLRLDDPDYFETRHDHNADSLRTRSLYPNGDSVQWVYESSLDACAPVRSRGNLREIHRLAGPLGADQTETVQLFEYDDGASGTNFVTRHVDARGNQALHSHDAAGNRLHTQHRIPAIVEDYEYNAFGQMTAHVLPDNGSAHRRRDEYAYYTTGPQRGYLSTRTIDVGGFALTSVYQYDARGNLVRSIDPRGHDTSYAINALDQVVRETSREVTTGSGVRYRLDTFYDANDNIERREVLNLDELGTPDPNNPLLTTSYAYDALDRLVRTTRERDTAHDVVTEYAYDANRNRTLVRKGEATNSNDPFNTVRLAYDERDRLFRVIRGEASFVQSTTQSDYDGDGNLKAVRQGLESSPQVTTYAYDGLDRLVRASDPMGNVTEHHYDPNGNPGGDQETGVPNPFAERTMGELLDVAPDSSGVYRLAERYYQYDPLDRPIIRTRAHYVTATQAPIGDGQSTAVTVYHPNSKVASTTDDNGRQSTYTYDTASRLRVFTDPEGNTRTYLYDANSNVVSITDVDQADLGGPPEVFVTTYSYDNLDRLIQTMDNVGNTVTHHYDSRSNETRTVDGRGNQTRYVYDGLDRRIETARDMTNTGDGGGSIVDTITTTQTWDDSSRLTARTDDNGRTTTYTYDSLDRLTGTSFADGTAWSATYTPHDTMTLEIWPNGSSGTYSYDALDRLTGKSITPGAGVSSQTTSETYQYDGLSRIVRAQDDDSLVLRTYDSLSHLTLESQQVVPTGPIRSHQDTYDGVGNLTRLVYPGGRTLVYSYDGLNRLTQVRDDPPGPGATIATYSYIGSGRIQRIDHGNGTRLDMGYDGVRRVTSMQHSYVPTATLLDERIYGWDAASNKTSASSTTLTPEQRSYGYDSNDRHISTDVLPGGPFIDYMVDGAGNRQFVNGPGGGSYFMDSTLPEPADSQVNQYTFTPLGGRQYDRDGALISAVSGTRTYQSDYKDRLVSFTDTGTGQTTTYRTDCFGRRLEKNVAGTISRFYHAGWAEIEEQNSFGATLATYAHGERGGHALLQMQRSALKRYYHADDLGNVALVTDTSGAVLERYRYGDYGAPEFFDPFWSSIPATQIENAFLFRSRRFDQETGFYRLGSRSLDPGAGRYTTRPGVGGMDSLGNAYTFDGNNPFRSLASVNILDLDWDATFISPPAPSPPAEPPIPIELLQLELRGLPIPPSDLTPQPPPPPDYWTPYNGGTFAPVLCVRPLFVFVNKIDRVDLNRLTFDGNTPFPSLVSASIKDLDWNATLGPIRSYGACPDGACPEATTRVIGSYGQDEKGGGFKFEKGDKWYEDPNFYWVEQSEFWEEVRRRCCHPNPIPDFVRELLDAMENEETDIRPWWWRWRGGICGTPFLH